MKFLSHVLLGFNQFKQAVLHKVSNATQDTKITHEGQIGYNTDDHMVLYHDGSGVRRLATMQDLNALITNATLPPTAFDASTETALPSERRRYIVSADGIVNGVSLQANDVLMPATETPTNDPADWIVIQGNLDKADFTEVVAGTDNVKYLTSAGLKHFRDNVLSADYVDMAGDGIGWDVGNKRFFVDVASDGGLMLDNSDGTGKAKIKLEKETAWSSLDIDYKVAGATINVVESLGGTQTWNYKDHRYVNASGVVVAGGTNPAFAGFKRELIYSEREGSYLFLQNIPSAGTSIGDTIAIASSTPDAVNSSVFDLGFTTLIAGTYFKGTSSTESGSQALYFNISNPVQTQADKFLQITADGLTAVTSSLNSPAPNTVVSATDIKAYVDLKAQSATPRIAFNTVSTTADTWLDVVHGFDLGAGAESNVFTQLFHDGKPVYAEMEVVDKDTIRVRTTADYTDLKVNLLTAPSA